MGIPTYSTFGLPECSGHRRMMEPALTDLDYLERFCKGDRTRMERYISMYLQGAPDLFAKLTEALAANDGDALAISAHSLRPQVNYMGAQRLFDMLTALEHRARAEGAAACTGMVHEVLELNGNVMAELLARPGHSS